MDARLIDWELYLRKIHLAGLNRYALKERKVYSLKTARQRKKQPENLLRGRKAFLPRILPSVLAISCGQTILESITW